jgi:hypothetical protein
MLQSDCYDYYGYDCYGCDCHDCYGCSTTTAAIASCLLPPLLLRLQQVRLLRLLPATTTTTTYATTSKTTAPTYIYGNQTLLLRVKGVLVGVDGDLSEAERSRLDIQSVTVCVGKCELKDDEGDTDEDGVDDEENRLCRTCGHLLPMIDLPTIEAVCRAAPTGLCPCCGLEDDAQTSMARPCGVCRSSWLLRNHNSDQRSWKEAEAAPVEDFGKGPYTDLATEEPDTPNRETTGHRTQDHARSPEAHCEVPSPGTPQALRERRTAAANARTTTKTSPISAKTNQRLREK